jgi:hypothetical protein
MKNEFVKYEQALSLKELGFDEPCLAFYDGKNTESVYFNHLRNASGDYIPFQKHDRLKWFGAPLKQQAFRWFREKCKIYHAIHTDKRIDNEGKELLYKLTCYRLTDEDVEDYSYRWAKSYEEAEQACLDKLIEICKNK